MAAQPTERPCGKPKSVSSSRKGLPPTAGSAAGKKTLVKKQDAEETTAAVKYSFEDSAMSRIADGCIGLGNVVPASFKPGIGQKDIYNVLLSHYGVADGTALGPPPAGAAARSLPPSRGRTPPAPPVGGGGDFNTETELLLLPEDKSFWTADINFFLPALFKNL